LVFIRPAGPVRVRDLQFERLLTGVGPVGRPGLTTSPAGVRDA